MSEPHAVSTFNSPLEAGLRALSVLVPSYPDSMDLQRLVAFDYLVVHTGDAGGPASLHPELPLRTAELLVRRQLVERGMLLMMSRGLVDRKPTEAGIVFQAGEMAETFLSSLTAAYLTELVDRGGWVVSNFAHLDENELRERMRLIAGQWIEEFQAAQKKLGLRVMTTRPLMPAPTGIYRAQEGCRLPGIRTWAERDLRGV